MTVHSYFKAGSTLWQIAGSDIAILQFKNRTCNLPFRLEPLNKELEADFPISGESICTIHPHFHLAYSNPPKEVPDAFSEMLVSHQQYYKIKTLPSAGFPDMFLHSLQYLNHPQHNLSNHQHSTRADSHICFQMPAIGSCVFIVLQFFCQSEELRYQMYAQIPKQFFIPRPDFYCKLTIPGGITAVLIQKR